MTKFSNTLIPWYLRNKRDLPWRNTSNPYFIWLSEIILQQTRVNQGLPYYEKFIENYPTVFDLAKANLEEVLKLWQGLGYYSRARNLHETAVHIVHNFNGVFPDNHRDLLKLKGVGDYTASAIASICFNEATAVVDGNVYRVLSRYFGIETPINSTKGIKEFKNLAQELIDPAQPATYNQAIMEFGATHCKPNNPLCQDCPFQDSCYALAKKSISILPVKERKVNVRKRYFNFLVFEDPNGETVFEQRLKKDIWKGLYQFPNLETPNEIQHDELLEHTYFMENFAIGIRNITSYNDRPIKHLLSHQIIFAKFWIINLSQPLNNGIHWSKIDQYPVSILIDNFLEKYKMNA